MKFTERNYQTIWQTVQIGDVIAYGKKFRFADVSFHALKHGVRLLPHGDYHVIVYHLFSPKNA